MIAGLLLLLSAILPEAFQVDIDSGWDRPRFVEIDAGADHACGRTEIGRVFCWGSSGWGQLGDGRATATEETPIFGPSAFGGPEDIVRVRPVELETTRRFRAVTTGGRHTCALTEAGEAYCWGMGRFGQLGTGSRSNAAVPVEVVGGLRFREISAGGTHTCAVTSSGEGYCWGGNWHGQLGEGTLASRSRPVRVELDRELASISAGGVHTCAVTRSAEAFCWGDRRDGRLGTGRVEEADRPRPVEVAGGIAWRRLAAGGAHTCGLGQDSRLHCWGRAREGQLGVGTETESLTEPAAVELAPEVGNVAAGPRHTCALAGERAWCWGEGTGAYVRPPGGGDADVPAVVEDIPTAADVAAGGSAFGSFTCVLTRRDVQCLADRRSVGPSSPDTTLEGSWGGEFEGPRAPIFLTLHLERVDEGWTGSLNALGETHPLEELAPTEDGVRAVLVPGPGGFSPEADLTDGHLRGWLSEGNARYPLEPTRVPRYQDPDGRVAAWRQDLNALTERFLRFDRSLTPAERSLFIERIGDLREELSELDDAEIQMRMAAAVALSENGHTRL